MTLSAWSSHAARSPSLEPKWCRTSPGLTSAAAAIARTGAPKPAVPKVAIAASRIRARAVRSPSRRDPERMFSTLNRRSVTVKGSGCGPRSASGAGCGSEPGGGGLVESAAEVLVEHLGEDGLVGRSGGEQRHGRAQLL